MTDARLPSGIVVSALVRRVNDAGGLGMVRAKGDAQAGGILLIVADRDGPVVCLERGIGSAGTADLVQSGPDTGSESDLEEYWRRRRSRDPDLWVVELDVAGAKRFAAESLLPN